MKNVYITIVGLVISEHFLMYQKELAEPMLQDPPSSSPASQCINNLYRYINALNYAKKI